MSYVDADWDSIKNMTDEQLEVFYVDIKKRSMEKWDNENKN